MIPGSYVIYQSKQVAKDLFLAFKYAPFDFSNIHYISDEVAAANLEMAILYHLAHSNSLLS